jgi:hypothetical protein
MRRRGRGGFGRGVGFALIRGVPAFAAPARPLNKPESPASQCADRSKVRQIMKTRILTVLALTSALSVLPAQAGRGHGHGHGRGDAAAWAIGGLLVGAVAGAAIASSSQPQVVYSAPPPAPPAPPVVVAAPAPAPAVVYVQGPPPPQVVVVRQAPVYYAPAPVVHCAPPPVVYSCPPPPVYFHGHGRPCPPVFRPHFRVGFSVGW